MLTIIFLNWKEYILQNSHLIFYIWAISVLILFLRKSNNNKLTVFQF